MIWGKILMEFDEFDVFMEFLLVDEMRRVSILHHMPMTWGDSFDDVDDFLVWHELAARKPLSESVWYGTYVTTFRVTIRELLTHSGRTTST